MTQYLIEEACMLGLHAAQAADLEELAGDDSEPEVAPGTITDPAMQDAMRKVKELHARQFGRSG